MSDEHKLDWTAADARKRLAEIMQNYRVIVPVELMEAWPQLLGYIEELEEAADDDDAALSEALDLFERQTSEVQRQAAEIERLKAENERLRKNYADARGQIKAMAHDPY